MSDCTDKLILRRGVSDCPHDLILRKAGGVRLCSRLDLVGMESECTHNLILRNGGRGRCQTVLTI